MVKVLFSLQHFWCTMPLELSDAILVPEAAMQNFWLMSLKTSLFSDTSMGIRNITPLNGKGTHRP